MDLLNNKNYGNIASSAPIFGPDDDERKKSATSKEDADSRALAEWEDGYGSFSKGVSPEVYKNTMSDIAGVKSRLRGYAAEDRDRKPVDSRFRNTFINTIDPGVTPERMQRQYAQSDAALDYVLGGSFGQDMKNRFDANRKASQERTNDDYVRNMSAIGSNPENAFYLSLKSDDPLKDVEKTIAGTDIQELEERVAPIVRHGGYDKQEYINEHVLPEMYGRLVDELIEEEVPKNSAEYILRSSLNNSLTGKVALLGKDLLTGSSMHTQLQNEALNRYKPGFFEDVFSGAGSLLVDAPVFSALGAIGFNAMSGVTAKLTNRLTTKILASKMGEGMTRATASEIARRIITRKLGHKILVSSGTQALTLGGYDALNSVVDDFLYQNDVNVGKAAESFGKGLLTGAVLGLVGTPLRESAKGLTGTKKALASAGVLSAESAVFTAGGLIEKMRYGIDIEPVDIMEDYAKSAATLIVMRMAHWRPAGASLKLDANGKLKEGFNLSSSERAELKELNVNPEQFITAIEAELKLPSFGGERARFIKDAYCTLMTSDRLSASAKSKLMFLVENKVTSTPPVTFDFTAEQRADGKWKINTYDSAGRIVSSNLFNHAGNAKSYLMVNRGEIRRNRIVLFETELTEGLRSENFLRQAGLYAKEKNKDIDEIATAVYKKSIGDKLDFHERVIVDDILQRASYDEAGMVQMLYDVRRKIEKRHGLEEGSMLLSVNKQFYELSDAQNAALDEYERVVRDEVDRLKHGTDRERSVRLLKQGLSSEYFGMNNEEVKAREIEDYHRRVAERNADRVGLYQQPRSSMAPRLLYIPPEDNSGYVWSYGEAKNTKEDIASYRKRADELADRFGIKLNYIFDEREIERPSAEDYNAVVEYNNQVVSSGWVNNGKVFINLPNAKNVQELEQTVLHEVVAHKGLIHVFGEHLYDFMEDVFKKASPEVLQGINRIKHKYRGADNYTVVEEYLAYLAENVKLEPQERTLYVRVKDYIKSLLIRLKLYTGSNRQISEAELTRIMQRHSEYMQRGTAPHDYMKEVFGDFKSAHYNGNTYYNRAEFNKDIASRIEKGKFFSSTPRLFRNSKEFMYYDFLPPEQQKRVRERHGLSEEDMQRYAGSGQFRVNRMPDGSYAPVDEKTSLSEWSGVIPGNSSSKGLLQGSSGHLSRYSLATHEDAANIQRNTELTKLSAKKSVNSGGFVDLKTTEDAVRKIGESLKLTKSKSSQSYYGDFYEGDIDVDGKTLHLRISTHPANGARIGNHPSNDKISIVLYKNGEHTSKDKNSDNAEHNGYVEYLYDPKDVSLNDAANSILNGVVELIERGEFVDFTGKAERMEYPYNKDGNLYYRLPDEPYNKDEKTTSGERSGAVPGNSSSGGLFLEGSAHLNRYPLAQPKHTTNIDEKTARIKYSAQKYLNKGGYDGSRRVQDVVRSIGRILQFDRSKTSQSYYSDLYVNGRKVLIRISTHPATNTRMGNSSADDKISLVVYNSGEHKDKGTHNGYTEYIYDPNSVSPFDAANAIIKGVVNLIENGEYVDYTNKAEKNTYPYNIDGNLYYRLPDEPYNNDEKTTSGERSGVIPGNSSSGGLLQVSNGHLSHYALTSQEDVTNIQRELPDSKFNVLKQVDENGEPLPEYYPRNDTKYRLPDDVFSNLTNEERIIISSAKENGTFLKAPNGKKTNLSIKDWARVRTKEFKELYGDWESAYKRDFLMNSKAVSNLTGNEFQVVAGKTLTDQVAEYFEKNGGKAISPFLGEVILDKNGADDSLSHGMGRNKAIVYSAVKEVIENGVLVDSHTNHKGRGYGTAIIAAPIEISGERYVCLVVVRRNANENRFYLHEVTLQKNLRNDAFVTNLAQKPASLGDITKILYEIADSKQDVLSNVNENGEPLPEYYPRNDTKYRLPDDAPNMEPQYRASDDLYQVHDGEERRSLEREALGRGKANDPTMEVPILEDPFFRSLRANSPTYSYAYEHLRKLPLEQWRSYDHDLWNTLVGMAEGGAVQFVLKDIVTDRNFLKDYPELAMVPVTIEKELPMPVMYDKARNWILIDRRIYLYPQSKFYIDGALRSVARDFDERRASAERQVGEFNTRFTKNYDDAVTFARKIEKMREFIPDFDADNNIDEAYRNEYGFLPDDFLRHFPTMDDYLLYRVTRSMGGLIREDATPEERRAKEGMLDKKIGKYRKFFWGPVEIIMDAAKSASGEGPLRVATKKDHENQELPSSGLDQSERAALFMKYFPGVFKYFNVPDPTIEYDRTGWEEYKRIRDAKIKAEKEKWGLDEEKLKEEERERKRLEMN